MTRWILTATLLCAAMSTGCTGSDVVEVPDKIIPVDTTPPTPKASNRCYSGQSQYFSPDGASAMADPNPTAARRDSDPDKGTIDEIVFDQGNLRPTRLTLQPDGATFSATDGETFDGTISTTGATWAWEGWTYNLTMKDGSGSVEGSGKTTAKGFETEKYFIAVGARQVMIRESFEEIDCAGWEALVEQLKADASSK